jgi:hypothetical protein
MLSYSLSSFYNYIWALRMHCIVFSIEISVFNSPHHGPYFTAVVQYYGKSNISV